jgi:ferredoxin-NADP reductase/ferredoxin
MPTITYAGQPCALNDGETVLDALTRHGVSVPNSCRAGACQSCLVRAVDGGAPANAQQGLKESLRARGFFLACQARPTGDLTVAPADDDAMTRAAAVLHRVERLSADVVRVLLKCDGGFDYRPGQFVHLVRDDGLSRSYSLASLGGGRDRHLELHVRKVAGGAMSTWLHDHAAPGQALEVRGPAGDCFYVPGRAAQPMLLAGTGTGLAPLYAIARDSLGQGHTGPIRLYHGGLSPAGLYLVDELTDLAARHPNLTYVRCVLSGDAAEPDPGVRVGDLEKLILSDLPDLAGWRVFLCGHPALVQSLRKRTFLAGARMKEIHSDAFVMRPPTMNAGV